MQDKEDQELFYRFTAWMKVVVKRAKIDYIRRNKKHKREVSVDDERILSCLTYDMPELKEKSDGFGFENSELQAAFSKLSNRRRTILVMLFVQNLCPEEIAKTLGCSVQYVYNQRSLGLKDLRNKLNRGVTDD